MKIQVDSFRIFLRISVATSHCLNMNPKLLAGKLRSLRAGRDRVARVVATICGKLPGHIDDHDLERYHLGMVKNEAELAVLEGHLLWCGACVYRAEAAARYVDTVRAAACDLAE
jgi:hypothetical protein